MKRAWYLATLSLALVSCALPAPRRTPASGKSKAHARMSPSSRPWGPDEARGELKTWEQRQAAQLAVLVRYAHAEASRAGRGPQRFGPAPSEAAPQPTKQPPGTRRKETPLARDRCWRICRHVAAICYAARRICRIAARLDEEAATATCSRARSRCRAARAIARTHCTTCAGREIPDHAD